MEKRKLTLREAVELREKLDREIHKNYQTIITFNSSDKSKPKKDLRELLRLTEVMEKQVIELKDTIQKSNLKRDSIFSFGASNSQNIIKLSQLKYKRQYLQKISFRSGKVGNTVYVNEFKPTEIDRMIHKIDDEIDKISKRLERFNESKKNTVVVKIEEDLLYLLN